VGINNEILDEPFPASQESGTLVSNEHAPRDTDNSSDGRPHLPDDVSRRLNVNPLVLVMACAVHRIANKRPDGAMELMQGTDHPRRSERQWRC
jgi:hypothetical protein